MIMRFGAAALGFITGPLEVRASDIDLEPGAPAQWRITLVYKVGIYTPYTKKRVHYTGLILHKGFEFRAAWWRNG